MSRYRVFFSTTASSHVDVDYDGDLTDETRDEIIELAIDQFEEPVLGICCTGGRFGRPSLELGDEWQAEDGGYAVQEAPEDAGEEW